MACHSGGGLLTGKLEESYQAMYNRPVAIRCILPRMRKALGQFSSLRSFLAVGNEAVTVVLVWL